MTCRSGPNLPTFSVNQSRSTSTKAPGSAGKVFCVSLEPATPSNHHSRGSFLTVVASEVQAIVNQVIENPRNGAPCPLQIDRKQQEQVHGAVAKSPGLRGKQQWLLRTLDEEDLRKALSVTSLLGFSALASSTYEVCAMKLSSSCSSTL